MMPTLETGDMILVNKYQYGLRLPVLNTKILPIGEPERGDVVVFRYPPDENIDYIKRVIGLPGDKIEYINKKLSINGKPVPIGEIGEYYDEAKMQSLEEFLENLTRQSTICSSIPEHHPAFIRSRAIPTRKPATMSPEV